MRRAERLGPGWVKRRPRRYETFIQGCRSCSATLSSLMPKYIVKMSCCSSTSRSRIASTHSCPRAAAMASRRLPTYCWLCGWLKPDRHDAARASFVGHRFPVARRLQRLGANLGAHDWIGQIFEELAVGRRPRRQRGGQPGAAGDVGVHVGGDIQPRCARRIDLLDHPRHLGPVCDAGRFEVIDLDRRARATRRSRSLRRCLHPDRALPSARG